MLLLLSWIEKDALVADALSASTTDPSTGSTPTTTATATFSPRIPAADVDRIASGGVAVLPGFVPADLVRRMRTDARKLQSDGFFRPDGLTNNALGGSQQQGFTRSSDRQTFRGNGSGSQQSWFREDLGDYPTRIEFDDLLAALRRQLAADLDRPTLLASSVLPKTDDDRQRHEITYNWYEPGAKLGRHLDEHHEETKGPKGWRYPSRRSVTWLVYLNDNWKAHEGGSLLCHPRSGHDGTHESASNAVACGPIGAHEGNLQVGWMDDHTPVYLDAFRDSGKTALYSCKPPTRRRLVSSPSSATTRSYDRVYWTKRDFDVPAQPIDFGSFLPGTLRDRFEQISTAAKDPRFAASGAPPPSPVLTAAAADNDNGLEVTPAGGTLVLFDSVTLPHSVLEVTGDRQRIAATGWFHEDSQFTFGA